MTESEETLWQYADESRDRIEALEERVGDLQKTVSVLLHVVENLLEKKDGK